jgi:hypothetical protein
MSQITKHMSVAALWLVTPRNKVGGYESVLCICAREYRLWHMYFASKRQNLLIRK